MQCSCGYSCGTWDAFTKHQQRFPGLFHQHQQVAPYNQQPHAGFQQTYAPDLHTGGASQFSPGIGAYDRRPDTYGARPPPMYAQQGTDTYGGRQGVDARADMYGRYGANTYSSGADAYGSRTTGSAHNDFGFGVGAPSKAGPLPSPLSYDYGSGGDMRMPPPHSQTLPASRSQQPPPSHHQTLPPPRSHQQPDMQPPSAQSQTLPSQANSSGSRRLAHVDENCPHEAPHDTSPHQRLDEISGSEPVDATWPRDRPPRAQRTMSYLSQEAIDGLLTTAEEVSNLEDSADDIDRRFESGALTAAQARTELSNVEAAANKVETKKIDSIYTGELNSGKDQAKVMKKDQINRMETLHNKLEALFKKLKSRS